MLNDNMFLDHIFALFVLLTLRSSDAINIVLDTPRALRHNFPIIFKIKRNSFSDGREASVVWRFLYCTFNFLSNFALAELLSTQTNIYWIAIMVSVFIITACNESRTIIGSPYTSSDFIYLLICATIPHVALLIVVFVLHHFWPPLSVTIALLFYATEIAAALVDVISIAALRTNKTRNEV